MFKNFLKKWFLEKNSFILAILQNNIDYLKGLSVHQAINLRNTKDRFHIPAILLAKFLQKSEFYRFLNLEKNKNLQRSTNFLPHIIFEDYTTFKVSVIKSRKLIPFLQNEKKWNAFYFKKEIEQNLHIDFSIENINSYLGKGIFAKRNIPPGSFIGEYAGIVRKRKRVTRDNVYCMRYPVGFDQGKKYVIDASIKGNFTRYINHSDQPSVLLQSVIVEEIPRMIFISIKEIKEGQQITFDYGTLFWKQTKKKPVKI